MKIPKIKIKVSVSKGDKITITSPEDMVEVIRKMFKSNTFYWTEEMILVCLSRANNIIGFYNVSSGGVTGTVCDPKVVMTVALQSGASRIIVAHNHPSGNKSPSIQDIDITRKLKSACEVMDIHLLDHIIITDKEHTSIIEEGFL
jgi:DNA repair protein RadC